MKASDVCLLAVFCRSSQNHIFDCQAQQEVSKAAEKAAAEAKKAAEKQAAEVKRAAASGRAAVSKALPSNVPTPGLPGSNGVASSCGFVVNADIDATLL